MEDGSCGHSTTPVRRRSSLRQVAELIRRRTRRYSLQEDPLLRSLPRGVNHLQEPNRHDFPEYAHLQGALHRGTKRELILGNPAEPYFFDNDLCSGVFLPLCRPTRPADKHLDNAEGWAYGRHFGKGRKWEMRIQMQFKAPVEAESLRFGAVLPEYNHMGFVAKRSVKTIIAAMRKFIGESLYHSIGEPPSKDGREVEMPTFALGMQAFDQIVVTLEGETPPALNDPNFNDFGVKFADGRAAFTEAVKRLELKPGTTFSCACWGLSSFADVVNWTVTGLLPMSVDLNVLGARPPVNMCIYSLKPQALTEDDQRHLESRKHVYFRCDLWSSLKSPSRQEIASLFPQSTEDSKPLAEAAPEKKDAAQKKRWYNKWLVCVSRTTSEPLVNKG